MRPGVPTLTRCSMPSPTSLAGPSGSHCWRATAEVYGGDAVLGEVATRLRVVGGWTWARDGRFLRMLGP